MSHPDGYPDDIHAGREQALEHLIEDATAGLTAQQAAEVRTHFTVPVTLTGGCPLIAAPMLRAATLAMDSVGNPVLGIPIGTAVCQGTGTCAAIPAA